MSTPVSSRSSSASPTASRSGIPRTTPAELVRLAALVTLGDDADREQLPVTAPFSGEAIGTVPVGTAADVAHAVERARAVQPDWADRPVRSRVAVLRRFRELVLENEAYLCDVIGTETGKSRYFCFAEVYALAEVARYYARRGPRLLGETRRSGPIPGLTAVRVRRRPVGVVGIIGPWNVPLELTIGDALPALLAGNTVVVKPAEQTPFSGPPSPGRGCSTRQDYHATPSKW